MTNKVYRHMQHTHLILYDCELCRKVYQLSRNKKTQKKKKKINQSFICITHLRCHCAHDEHDGIVVRSLRPIKYENFMLILDRWLITCACACTVHSFLFNDTCDRRSGVVVDNTNSTYTTAESAMTKWHFYVMCNNKWSASECRRS